MTERMRVTIAMVLCGAALVTLLVSGVIWYG
jgi:hypothetical protein